MSLTTITYGIAYQFDDHGQQRLIFRHRHAATGVIVSGVDDGDVIEALIARRQAINGIEYHHENVAAIMALRGAAAAIKATPEVLLPS